jgi:hypothetical protein
VQITIAASHVDKVLARTYGFCNTRKLRKYLDEGGKKIAEHMRTLAAGAYTECSH